MKRLVFIYLTVMGLNVIPTCFGTDLKTNQTWQGQAKIRFFGTSTLHHFSGNVACETFTWKTMNDPNRGEPVIRADIDLLVQNMDTDNKGRNKNMYQMFQIKKYPRIHGTIQDANLAEFKPVLKATNSDQPPQDAEGGRGRPGTLPFLLTIRDKQQEVVCKVSHMQTGPKDITFTLDFEVSLKAFGLKPPSVLGVIRVGDRVRLQADVTLSPPMLQKEPAMTDTSPSRSTTPGSQRGSSS